MINYELKDLILNWQSFKKSYIYLLLFIMTLSQSILALKFLLSIDLYIFEKFCFQLDFFVGKNTKIQQENLLNY